MIEQKIAESKVRYAEVLMGQIAIMATNTNKKHYDYTYGENSDDLKSKKSKYEDVSASSKSLNKKSDGKTSKTSKEDDNDNDDEDY